MIRAFPRPKRGLGQEDMPHSGDPPAGDSLNGCATPFRCFDGSCAGERGLGATSRHEAVIQGPRGARGGWDGLCGGQHQQASSTQTPIQPTRLGRMSRRG